MGRLNKKQKIFVTFIAIGIALVFGVGLAMEGDLIHDIRSGVYTPPTTCPAGEELIDYYGPNCVPIECPEGFRKDSTGLCILIPKITTTITATVQITTTNQLHQITTEETVITTPVVIDDLYFPIEEVPELNDSDIGVLLLSMVGLVFAIMLLQRKRR